MESGKIGRTQAAGSRRCRVGRDGYDDRYDDDAPYTDERHAYDAGYTGEFATGYGEGYTDEYSAERALALRNESEYLPAELDEDEDDIVDETGPMVIPGTGVSMGDPKLGMGHRSLTMRVAVLTLMTAILVSGLFAVTPLGSSADGGGGGGVASSFQALSGAVVLHSDVSYHWYVAQWNDTPESVARAQHVQVGGIYELNGLLAGQELTVGKTYKIPDDPNYGANYRPAQIYQATATYGETTYGNSMWASHAGDPPPEAPCGIDGHGVPTAYQLKPPNPGAHYIRGFTWFHNGVDLAATNGNPIRAAQAGEVVWAGWANDGFGYSVKVNHCFHISTAYGHMQQLLVHVHDYVQPGDTIGLEGSTGWSTGPHLHFMVEVDNVPIDPMPYYNNSQDQIADPSGS
jgi:hypothetical protein